LGKVSM